MEIKQKKKVKIKIKMADSKKNKKQRFSKSPILNILKISWIGPWVNRIFWCEGHWWSSSYMAVRLSDIIKLKNGLKTQQRKFLPVFELTLCLICLRSFAFLWCKMPMFWRVGMREGGKLIPLAFQYRISANSFRGNYSFLNLALFTVTFDLYFINLNSCRGNYSREETIQGRKLFAEIRYTRNIFFKTQT